jgi:type VI secretion system protein
MPLIVTLEATDPALGPQGARRIEIDQRLSIGRGPENDLVLTDPARVLSKSHCVIEADGRDYTVTDSSTNGVFLNQDGERLSKGVPTPLKPGDVLQIGGYLLSVTELRDGGMHQKTESQGGATQAAVERDPFDDLLAEFVPTKGGDARGGIAAGSSSREPPPDFGSVPDFDDAPAFPNERPAGGSAADFTPLAPPFAGSPFNEPLTDHRRPTPVERPILSDADDMFGPKSASDDWSGASEADHVAGESAFFAPPKVSIPQIPDEWDDLLNFDPPAAVPDQSPNPPQPQAQSAAGNVFAEPSDRPAARRSDMPAAAVSAAAPSAVRPASAADRGAVAALLEASGLGAVALDDVQTLALMERLGRTLRILVPGLIEILASRSSTKQEFHIDRTMLGAHDNNPLKFSASTDEAMRVLLLQGIPGFLAIDQAVDQALADIKKHQLAVLAGMQVALETVIGRFDPAQLETRLERRSVLEGILPQGRKARYWELFKALHGEIVRELHDDLQKLFGAEFAEAYRAQIDRLTGDGGPS